MNIKNYIDEALLIELLILIEELKEKHIALGQKASGKWIESLKAEVSNGKGVIYAEHYTEQLTKGRRPGARPPINPLKEWAQRKLGVSEENSLGVAFAIATKIANEGTNIYKDGGSDLLDGVITTARVDRLITNVGEFVGAKITEELIRA